MKDASKPNNKIANAYASYITDTQVGYFIGEPISYTSNDDTLLYGCESKYYSLKPDHNDKFEIADRLYLIGDGSGIARGLSQSAAMGLYVGEDIAKKEEVENQIL